MHDHEATIPGSDVDVSIYRKDAPIPIIRNPDNPHLPKTDWSRDGIIANDD